MTRKDEKQDTTGRSLHAVGRVYGCVGWLGLGTTAFFAAAYFVNFWNFMSNFGIEDLFSKLLNSLLAASVVLVIGLGACGLAFVISLFLRAFRGVIENSDAQTDLLRQLVHETSEQVISNRLIEREPIEAALPADTVYEQTQRHR